MADLKFQKTCINCGIPINPRATRCKPCEGKRRRGTKNTYHKLPGENKNFKPNSTSPKLGRDRARRWFKAPAGKERHHIDGNPLNNDPSNIMFVTTKEHMIIDGRLEAVRQRLLSPEFDAIRRRRRKPPNLICKTCGKAIRVKPSRLSEAKYCSHPCYIAYRYGGMRYG